MPRIDEEKLNEYADAVFNRCNYFNDYVLEIIGGRIKATGRLSAYDSKALKNIADISGDMDAITKKLAEITQLNIRDIEAIYAQVITEGTVSYKPLYDFKNLPFVPFEQNGFAKNLVHHWAAETAETMINLSRTKALCFDKYDLHGALVGSVSLAGAYQKAIDDAVIALSAGTVDFNTAMRGTIKQLGGSGVKVNYGGGVTRSLAGMVRQNLLYGAKQAAQSYDEYVGSELGCDGFEVDYHPHPRPSHEVIGGEMFAYGPNDITIDGITYTSAEKDLEGNGSAESLLNDYGCLHFKYSVILGVSEPRYAPQWLAEQKRKDKELIEFNGVKKTKYEWQQAARRLERGIRQERDTAYMARASGDKTLENKCSEKISAYRKTYDDLCGKTGLPKRYDRFAAYYPQNVDNGGKSGIIKMLPQIDEAEIAIPKFTEYALNPLKEPNKAKAFKDALGYEMQDTEELIENIRKNLKNFEAVEKPDNGYGKRYEVLMALIGKNGNKANVKTAWITDKETGKTRLTSAYVTRKKFKEE